MPKDSEKPDKNLRDATEVKSKTKKTRSLQSLSAAEILIQEGLLDDAKKILRQILRKDSSNISARNRLREIESKEIHALLSGSGTDSTQTYTHSKKKPQKPQSTEKLMRELDRDLQLGVFGDSLDVQSLTQEMEFFGTKENYLEFQSRIDRLVATLGEADRLDLGVAFMEMGFFEVSTRVFESLARTAAQKPELEMQLIAGNLMASSQLSSGHPFEAIMTIEPLIHEAGIAHERKIDLFYLMGRANELLGKWEQAKDWYARVLEIDPRYRDVKERLMETR